LIESTESIESIEDFRKYFNFFKYWSSLLLAVGLEMCATKLFKLLLWSIWSYGPKNV